MKVRPISWVDDEPVLFIFVLPSLTHPLRRWGTVDESRKGRTDRIPPLPSLPRQGMLRGMPYQRVGWVFLAGVRPGSPPRSDTFLLLRVATRLTRGRRVRSYVVRQARTNTIRAFFIGSSGRAAILNRDVRARRQAPPQAKLRHSLLRR